jgi:hypothetical protein
MERRFDSNDNYITFNVTNAARQGIWQTNASLARRGISSAISVVREAM